MALIRDWKNDIKSINHENLTKIKHALNTLQDWNFYRKQYPEIVELKNMIECQLCWTEANNEYTG